MGVEELAHCQEGVEVPGHYQVVVAESNPLLGVVVQLIECGVGGNFNLLPSSIFFDNYLLPLI